MRTNFLILTLLCAVTVSSMLVACEAGVDKEPELVGRQLLRRYDWILMSLVRNETSEDPEPAIEYVVYNFRDSTFRGSDSAGDFRELGKWKLNNNSLILDQDTVQLEELSLERLIYVNKRGDVYTRLSVPKQ